MVKLLYFARLREALGVQAEEVELPPGVRTVDALRSWLAARGGAWADELGSTRPVRAAVNMEMADGMTEIPDACEIAFFPPVTGG